MGSTSARTIVREHNATVVLTSSRTIAGLQDRLRRQQGTGLHPQERSVRVGHPRIDRLTVRWATPSLVLAMVGLTAAVEIVAYHGRPVPSIADGMVGATLLICGVLAWRLRAARGVGALMLLAGATWLLGHPGTGGYSCCTVAHWSTCTSRTPRDGCADHSRSSRWSSRM